MTVVPGKPASGGFAALCMSRFECNRGDVTLIRVRPGFSLDQVHQPLPEEQACWTFSELHELSCGSDSGDKPIRCDEGRDEA